MVPIGIEEWGRAIELRDKIIVSVAEGYVRGYMGIAATLPNEDIGKNIVEIADAVMVARGVKIQEEITGNEGSYTELLSDPLGRTRRIRQFALALEGGITVIGYVPTLELAEAMLKNQCLKYPEGSTFVIYESDRNGEPCGHVWHYQGTTLLNKR